MERAKPGQGQECAAPGGQGQEPPDNLGEPPAAGTRQMQVWGLLGLHEAGPRICSWPHRALVCEAAQCGPRRG